MRALPFLLLCSCLSTKARVEGLTDLGWYGEACSLAADDSVPTALRDRLVRAHADPPPTIDLKMLPASTFGPHVPGYGTEWAVMEATLSPSATPSPEVDPWVELVVPGTDGARAWAVCHPDTCHAAWVAERAGATSKPARSLWDALMDVGKILILPVAIATDAALVPARVLGDDDLGPPLSMRLLDSVGGDRSLPAAPYGFPSVWEAPVCSGLEPCVRRWVTTSTDATSAPGLRVRLTWSHAACDVEATWQIDAPAGNDLAAALANLPLPLALPADAMIGGGVRPR